MNNGGWTWLSMISALLISSVSIVVPAETLELTSTEYLVPKGAPSCGLLHQRELQQEKVMRELDNIMKVALKRNERALVPLDCLLTNKLFMPKDTWMDDSVEVAVRAKVSEAMWAEIKQIGFKNVFIRTDGPGFVWASLAGQLPEEVSILQDGDALDIRYKTYLNATCEQPLRVPTVEWIPRDFVPGIMTTWDVVAKLEAVVPGPTWRTNKNL